MSMTEISRTTPTTTTVPAERSKPTPSAPSPAAPKKEKADKGPLPETQKAAIEGAKDVKKSVGNQPTEERKAVVGAYKTGEAAAKTAIAGVKEIGSKVASGAKDLASGAKDAGEKVASDTKDAGEKVASDTKDAGEKVASGAKDAGEKVASGAKEAGKKVASATKPLHEPFTRETKEADREISDAGSKFGSGWLDSLNPFDEKNVNKAADDAPTIERAIVLGGIEAAKNVVGDGVRNVKNLGNLGREAVEGAAEIALHNPVNNAVREVGTGAAELGSKGLKAAGSWIGDRIRGGAEGAVKASKEARDTSADIADRSKDQAEENGREIREAAGNFGDNYGFGEAARAWNDQPTIERQVVVGGWEVAENLVQGNARTIADAGRLASEVTEAAAENVTTGLRNTGDAITGGAKAASKFVGGLFG